MNAHVLVLSGYTETIGEIADRLRSAGCTVQESGHAGEALHMLEVAVDAARPVEVVVVDERLSGVDAQLFAELVREDPRLSSARLVLLTECAAGGFEPYAAVGYAGRVELSMDAGSLAEALGATLHSSLGSSPAVGAVEADSSPMTAAAGVSILLVEDNEINMEVAREMIGKVGYRCDHAANGHEAVEAVKRSRYSLVLMDCQMPRMDGYEATRRIRAWEEANGEGRHVPIVAVTAHAMTGDRERCLAAGMDDYLTKPVEGSRLVATIAKWLNAS